MISVAPSPFTLENDVELTVEVESIVRRVDWLGELVVRGRSGTRWIEERLLVRVVGNREGLRVIVAFEGGLVGHGGREQEQACRYHDTCQLITMDFGTCK